MPKKKPYIHLNAFMVKEEYRDINFDEFLKHPNQVNSYDIDEKFELEGKLFVKIPDDKKPRWTSFAQNITGSPLDEINNRSSSAILIIKAEEVTFAFSFGYGRFLIDTKYFVHDFGIKTALNTLNHDSLRSVDLFTLDDQAVQKKAQASRESGVGIFGIDISKDVLRAVTGSPKLNVDLQNISGGDAVFSFGKELYVEEIAGVAKQLQGYYQNDSYKEDFSWVDNIRKIKEKSEVDNLDEKLLQNIKAKNQDVVITIPEIVQWDSIWGFSFTRSKTTINPTINTLDYFDNIDVDSIDIKSIKRDKLFVFDTNENEFDYQIYKSIYFEYKDENKTFILFSGFWYEIDNTFMKRIDNTLDQIQISNLQFPSVYTWEEKDQKSGKIKKKIETEGDYNERAAQKYSYHLLDKKLIKTNRTTTSIELCDLLTDKKQFIHVKHRKGGSAGLSHLFAQGNISSEILLGDREFRKAARKVLRKVKNNIQSIVPLDNFRSDEVEIVFLILGEHSDTLKNHLPFFSKVNLSKTYENLTQRGFQVTVAGVDKEPKPDI